MSTIIKRNEHLKNILQYWNHNDPSIIGVGLLTRKLNNQGIYVISRSWGRRDLKLFNVSREFTIDSVKYEDEYEQYSIEPFIATVSFTMLYNKYKNKVFETLLETVTKWFKENKKDIKIQLHYLKWFELSDIEELKVEELKSLLETYIYNDEEAEILYNKIYKDYVG